MRYLLFLFITLAAACAHADEEPGPTFKWSGDLRMRTQFDRNGTLDARWQEKLRARLDLNIGLPHDLHGEVRMASQHGSRSSNQILGDSSDPGEARRYNGLDLGYVDWTPASFFKLYGGRFPILNYRPGASQVLLYEDLALEGAGFSSDIEVLNSNYHFFLDAGSVFVRNNYDETYSQKGTDNKINWMQGGLKMQFAPFKVNAGSGFYNFVGVQGHKFAELSSGGTSGGNSATPSANGDIVKYPYLPREYFIEGIYHHGETDYGVFAQRVINNEVAVNNSAWWVGVNATQKKWDAQIAYAEVKPDAVLNLFTNPDYAAGFTDSKGLVITARWRFARGMNIKLTEYINRIRANQDNAKLVRTYLDLNASF